jgi:hypothetical protein
MRISLGAENTHNTQHTQLAPAAFLGRGGVRQTRSSVAARARGPSGLASELVTKADSSSSLPALGQGFPPRAPAPAPVPVGPDAAVDDAHAHARFAGAAAPTPGPAAAAAAAAGRGKAAGPERRKLETSAVGLSAPASGGAAQKDLTRAHLIASRAKLSTAVKVSLFCPSG